MNYAKTLLKTLLIIIVLAVVYIAVAKGIDKTLAVECNGWVTEYDTNVDNPHYYWTQWQVDQCAHEINYTYSGVVAGE